MANRLSTEKSPYLLQHADNPVDWYPWGEEAFAKARAEGKPVFLSVGYSTCHWCHVMAHESFEDPATAAVMNQLFVNIKVDREERPDVDQVYMAFVQALTGSGGWPMSVWLTPDRKPFYGGTYFPPEKNLYGRPGFTSLLRRIAAVWQEEREKVLAQGDRMAEMLRDQTATPGPARELPGEDGFSAAVRAMVRSYDPEWGGFGGAPKFPRPVTLYFLFRHGDPSAREMALHTLRKMADGGMHDHVGGGFHRYSVDAQWHVPHFEKMLYDQAQLAVSYLEAFQLTRDPFYAAVARDIFGYVRRDLAAPEGGFYSAEDADSLIESGKSAHAEGAFYVWSAEDIEHVLGKEDAAFFNRQYGVERGGNAAHADPHGEFEGKNVLIRREPPPEGAEAVRLEECRRKLLLVREKRPRPHRDDKIITAWNGLMISALAKAAQVLGEQEYRMMAEGGARFLRAHLWQEGKLLRNFRQGAGKTAGFAEDYAFLIQGLLDLYEAGFAREWLEWAMELQERQNTLFWDESGGGYFSAEGGEPELPVRMKNDYDGAEPSPNSIAASNLLRLVHLGGPAAWQEKARRTVAAFAPAMEALPQGMPQMWVALGALHRPPLHLVVAGRWEAEDTQALLAEIHRCFLPYKTLLFSGEGKEAENWPGQWPLEAALKKSEGRATVYLCENFACQWPIQDPASLRERLAGVK
jgi:uncharacterized protein YyaL (SSP411 family)